jgi:hypothetical protein
VRLYPSSDFSVLPGDVRRQEIAELHMYGSLIAPGMPNVAEFQDYVFARDRLWLGNRPAGADGLVEMDDTGRLRILSRNPFHYDTLNMMFPREPFGIHLIAAGEMDAVANG